MAFIDFSLDSRIRKKYVPLVTQQVNRDYIISTKLNVVYFLAISAACQTNLSKESKFTRGGVEDSNSNFARC